MQTTCKKDEEPPMPIFRLQDSSLASLKETTFEKKGILEEKDLRPLLKSCFAEILPGTMIVAEEFRDWEGSDRSIDLLAVDKKANLVVIELKRTVSGGHAELQAIRYSAMISKLTFEQMVVAHKNYLNKYDIDGDAEGILIDFFDWHDTGPREDEFGQEVKIVLMSSDFSTELTTSVVWLRDFEIDIRCIRMKPYDFEGTILIDVQTVVPMPEIAEFEVKIQEKIRKERQFRAEKREYYDGSISGSSFSGKNKRDMMFTLIKGILDCGHSPDEVGEIIREYTPSKVIEKFSGELSVDQVQRELRMGGRGEDSKRDALFFSGDDEIFLFEGNTYVFTKQWSKGTMDAARQLSEKYPDLEISVTKSV